jgi:hypothetical protein
MKIPGDPLPSQWQVVLKDGSVIGVWADSYGEAQGHYTFEILADASAEEQADDSLVISAETPSNPQRIMFTVARIPIELVANIFSRGWDTTLDVSDLDPTEWAPRPQ